MNKRAEIEAYGLDSYDDYLCLRPTKLLIACMLFLCRGILLSAAIGLSRGVPAVLRGIVTAQTLWTGVIAAIPAALVLYALSARAPGASAFVRFSWRHGRALMAVSALAYIGFTVAELGSNPHRWLTSSIPGEALVLVELGIIVYLALSQRVRQTFLQFPAA